jgi:hypothetical protein
MPELEVVVGRIPGQPDFFPDVVENRWLALTLQGIVVAIRQEKQRMPFPPLRSE